MRKNTIRSKREQILQNSDVQDRPGTQSAGDPGAEA